MKIIVGCERSQIITKAFRERGHEAYSCDIQECQGDHPEWHFKESIFNVLKRHRFDLGIFHPPCTYLCVTANKWFTEQPARKSGALVGAERQAAREEAFKFFMDLWNADIEHICMENPVGVVSSLWRPPDQIIQPFQFGHPEPKKTCLWLKNLPKLVPTKIVEPEYHVTESGKRVPKWFFYADRSKGQAHRAGIRSQTFEGVAQAMADQWSEERIKKQVRLTLF